MAKAETTSTRAPRGSKIVTQAFFAALDAVPKMQQAAVFKAAQTMIRDEFKARKGKAVTAAAKERAKAPARTAAPAARAAAKKPAPMKTPRARAKPVADTEA
jgi:hypothetical protein